MIYRLQPIETMESPLGNVTIYFDKHDSIHTYHVKPVIGGQFNVHKVKAFASREAADNYANKALSGY